MTRLGPTGSATLIGKGWSQPRVRARNARSQLRGSRREPPDGSGSRSRTSRSSLHSSRTSTWPPACRTTFVTSSLTIRDAIGVASSSPHSAHTSRAKTRARPAADRSAVPRSTSCSRGVHARTDASHVPARSASDTNRLTAAAAGRRVGRTLLGRTAADAVAYPTGIHVPSHHDGVTAPKRRPACPAARTRCARSERHAHSLPRLDERPACMRLPDGSGRSIPGPHGRRSTAEKRSPTCCSGKVPSRRTSVRTNNAVPICSGRPGATLERLSEHVAEPSRRSAERFAHPCGARVPLT